MRRFGSNVAPADILTGSGIIDLCREYMNGLLRNRRLEGLYFIFFQTDKGAVIPVYVGLGDLLSRLVVHLRPPQYVDQVLGVHFGGIHSRPWLLPEATRARFDAIKVGFVLAKGTVTHVLEERFIDLLRPVTNSKWYTTAELDRGVFSLPELAERWLARTRPRQLGKLRMPPEFNPTVTNTDLDALRSAHEAMLQG